MSTKNNDYRTYSIYGIFVNNTNLYYIGVTGRDPQKRFDEHKYYVEHKYKSHVQQDKLYKGLRIALSKGWNVDFRVLHQIYTNRTQAEMIELDFIQKLRPRYNIIGITKPYGYSPKKKPTKKKNF